jgi:RNA polymerase sigma factor (sigma-70 family)
VAEELVGVTARSDAELITAVRVGDTAAYEELYRRHVNAAMSVARHLTGSKADAEDVVSEAFARVLSALQRGVGPEMAFRPYLLTSVRNAFYDRTRKDKRLDVTDDVPEDLGQVLAAAAASENDAERKMAATAFASLPERWQLVLWHTEVEGSTPAEVGPLLGLAPNAVAALAYRAREGLRQAYLNAHVQARPPAGCAEIVPKLGAYVRDDLSNRDRVKVEEHLAGCARCRDIVAELEEAGARLPILLIPMIAGVPAAAYLSGIGAAAGGVVAGAAQRFKEVGPASQAAALAGAVVVVGSLVVGAFAVSQNLGRGGPSNEAAVTVPSTNASAVTSPGGGSVAPNPTEAPSTPSPATPTVTVPPSGTASPAPATTAAPSATPATSPATPSPTPAPTTPTTPGPTPPPTAPPPAVLAVSIGSVGPVYAGQDAALPVAVGNGTPVAAQIASGPGIARGLLGLPAGVPGQPGPANEPTVVVPLPAGVSFGSIDNPEWACAADASQLQCVLPALAPGAISQAIIQLAVADNAPPEITLQPFVSDGTDTPVTGPPLVITVQPAPVGLSDIVIDKADLALIGNAVLTCDPAIKVDDCVTARDDPAGAPGHADKSKQHMIWVDVDADPTTFNSSSATLSLPPDTEVITARLLWGGTVQPGVGGVAPPDPTATGTVALSTPGAPGPTPIAATAISPDPSSPNRYVATADVTSLVGTAGAGVYTLANLQVATGPNAFGGWALQVVYRDPAAPIRMVALADEVVTLNSGASATIELNGLEPSDTARDGVLSLAAFDGDFGLLPEEVAVNDQPLSNAGNAADNPMNGSITTPGDRVPAYVNNFGFDADQFAVTVAPGQSTVSVTASTHGDRFRLAALGISVPV